MDPKESAMSSYDPSIFHPDTPWTLGVELEVRLLDTDTLLPANRSPDLLAHLPANMTPYVPKELLQSMIEIVTPVCHTPDATVRFIDETVATLATIGRNQGIVLAALATHPFERKEDNERFDDPRYDLLAQELQIVLKNFLISGLHIHVALPNETAAINAYNASIRYLPFFLALSVNSPFALGEDTGLQSYRSKIFERLPRAGVPEPFKSYRDYARLIDRLIDSGTIESIKDVWWDVRIHQRFGTVELRVCDAFYDHERLRLIVLLYQALVYYSSTHPPSRDPYQIYRQNKWNALRHGLHGDFIDRDKTVTIREGLIDLIGTLERAGTFSALKAAEDLPALIELVGQETLARTLRRTYRQTRDFSAVVQQEVIR
jgi:carboxylate-amine ligase